MANFHGCATNCFLFYVFICIAENPTGGFTSPELQPSASHRIRNMLENLSQEHRSPHRGPGGRCFDPHGFDCDSLTPPSESGVSLSKRFLNNFLPSKNTILLTWCFEQGWSSVVWCLLSMREAGEFDPQDHE